MHERDLLSVDEDCRGTDVPVAPRRSVWRTNLMRQAGKAILAVCRNGGRAEPCANLRCVLRPFCACAQAELRAANRMETRIWLAIAFCGAVLLVVALIRVVAAG